MVNKEEFITLKQSALRKRFEKMNEQQQLAIFTVKGAVLILAGAGSGKTTVLVNRIANMINFGNTFNSDYCPEGISNEDLAFLADYITGKETDNDRLKEIVSDNTQIQPWNILAITFTNKAAGELRERLSAMLGDEGKNIAAATFHSACVRILRREIDKLGYKNNFTIYDSDDSQRVVKGCLSDLNISEKQFSPKSILSIISGAKDQLITPQDFEAEAGGDYRKQIVAKVYAAYQSRLFAASAMDFDDIIRLTVELFEKFPDVLEHYQNLYKYVMVDEYQDTNQAQYRLVSMLSAKSGNLCVVGDDDQSIYKFRGATIENILNFEKEFTFCTTIRLEQNYRSTQNILSAANSVIANNKERKDKKLWTDAGDGEKVTIYKSQDEFSESKFVSETILNNIKDGGKFSDHAVLYRMNAQSNMLERIFVQSGIPYRVVGGLRFYDRKEIKDIVAYLSVINNNDDVLRLKRIINEPKRGIGDATLGILEQISQDLKISPIEVMRNAESYPPLSKKANVLGSLVKTFDNLTELSTSKPLDEFIDDVLEETGYLAYMKTLGDDGLTRIENLNELKSTMLDYQKAAEEPSLSGFLEEISLYTDVDKLSEESDTVIMMTMHAAKGLEFPTVFIVGMEEGIFPGTRSMNSEADLEEERRLAYVAITRAKQKLYITHSLQRMLFGQTSRNIQSRFIKEINADFVEKIDATANLKKSAPQKPVNAYSLQNQIASHKTIQPAKNTTEFAVGDRISHNIFGEGTVISVRAMSNDAMLEVAFDKSGTKKLMANFAKIQKK
ncbi:MAG: 3'-5' exonuclease [Oscillospiraceae bacterium]